METNILLTTAFEIECRATSTGLRASAPAMDHFLGNRLSSLPVWHFVEIDGDPRLSFVAEACDA